MASGLIPDCFDLVQLDRPHLDRRAAAAALREHGRRAGAKRVEVRWVADPEFGYQEALRLRGRGYRPWNNSGVRHPDRGWSGHWTSSRWPSSPLPQMENEILRASRRGASHPSNKNRHGRMNRIITPLSVSSLLVQAAEDERIVANEKPPPSFDVEWWKLPRVQHRAAIAKREAWSRWRDSPDRQAGKRLELAEALIKAMEAGLFCFWPYHHPSNWGEMICVAVPRPTIHTTERTQRGRTRRILHHADKPAVSWKNGTHYWYWQGIRIWREVAENPSRLTARYIVNTRDAERRRVLLDHLGYDRFLASAGAEIIQQDDYGKLWRTDLRMDGEAVTVVEVTNATQEPDGSYRHYFLRVPPDTRTARAAVAWTFGFTNATAYQTSIQT